MLNSLVEAEKVLISSFNKFGNVDFSDIEKNFFWGLNQRKPHTHPDSECLRKRIQKTT